MNDPPDTTHVECPHCHEVLTIRIGDWPFRYSQLLKHLDGCAGEMLREERERIAWEDTAEE